jgi:hypothetical protein
MTKLIIAFRNFANVPNDNYFPVQHKLTGFVTEKESVYCAVRTKPLYIIQVNTHIQRLKEQYLTQIKMFQCSPALKHFNLGH